MNKIIILRNYTPTSCIHSEKGYIKLRLLVRFLGYISLSTGIFLLGVYLTQQGYWFTWIIYILTGFVILFQPLLKKLIAKNKYNSSKDNKSNNECEIDRRAHDKFSVNKKSNQQSETNKNPSTIVHNTPPEDKL